jgi:cytochrome c oxidase subunit 4
MLGAGWLHLGSLVLGLVAWILPVVNLVQHNKGDNRNWAAFSVASVSTCAMSLCLQIYYTSHLVEREDWSALMDTIHAVALVATILLVVTLILNAITLVVYTRKTPKDR